MILWSFDFANDRAHAFFMDNVEWSHADSYFFSFVSDDVEERYTENVYLDSLSVKQKFKFIFDFGDEWRFECQVLRARQRTKKLISYVRLERRQNNIQIMMVLTMKNGKIEI
ncbi:Uncharacterised protein [Streptococcus pneumoniae]|nr:Uncharacterised protein [Streptococcus pneumoniae]